jgi:threonine synthase
MLDYKPSIPFDPAQIERAEGGIWRYVQAYPLPAETSRVSLGEGGTPLIWTQMASRTIGLKMESQNPTGSYKDRGTAVLVSHLKNFEVKKAVEDSSGNAGASFAAYAARAGLQARIYIPASASGPKRKQIEDYGADLVTVEGARSAASLAVQQEVQRGEVYASHAYSPFWLAGLTSLAFEIWEDMQAVPGSIIAPVGHGGLMTGLVRGFHLLQNSDVTRSMPYFLGVQANPCAPLVHAYSRGDVEPCNIDEGSTIAEGIRVRNPSHGGELLSLFQRGIGAFTGIDEQDILPAQNELALQGISVEPTSAVVWHAAKRWIEKLPEPILLIMSGSGLKYQ